MKTLPETLPDSCDELRKMMLEREAFWSEQVIQWQEKSGHWQHQYQALLEQWRLARHKRFAASSEEYPGQGELFNEAEQENDRAAGVQPEEADNAESDTVTRRRHIRPKYSCRQCEQQGTEVSIQVAPVPPAILPRSIATPSLLAQIISSKFQFSLPLYRQEQMFAQLGIELGRQTMSSWMLKCAALLARLYELLHQQLLTREVIWSDDTTLKVVETKKNKCYMWVYGCGGDNPAESQPPGIVLYDYQDGRGEICPTEFLHGYHGWLQADGYAGYSKTTARVAGCMAHARRKFMEAKVAQPKGKTGRADLALSQIQKLYRAEQALKGQPPDIIVERRQQEAKPLLDEFKIWLDKTAPLVPPGSLLGKAVTYSLNQWSKLVRYLEHGHLSIDNNRAERAIKPFVIGRKNWMLANTRSGARASALLYSLVETAKANGLIPFDYLMHIFTLLPQLPYDSDLTQLLPWNVTLARSGTL